MLNRFGNWLFVHNTDRSIHGTKTGNFNFLICQRYNTQLSPFLATYDVEKSIRPPPSQFDHHKNNRR